MRCIFSHFYFDVLVMTFSLWNIQFLFYISIENNNMNRKKIHENPENVSWHFSVVVFCSLCFILLIESLCVLRRLIKLTSCNQHINLNWSQRFFAEGFQIDFSFEGAYLRENDFVEVSVKNIWYPFDLGTKFKVRSVTASLNFFRYQPLNFHFQISRLCYIKNGWNSLQTSLKKTK